MGQAPRHDVELVEDHDPQDDPAPHRGPRRPWPDGGPVPRRRRRLVVGGLVVLAVATAGAVGAQVVVDRGERARLAVVAQQPGALRLVDGPPEALWTVPDGAELLSLRATPDGTLVGPEPGPDGPQVVARDAGTGATLWEAPLLDVRSTEPPPAGAVLEVEPGTCEVAQAVVCLAVATVSLPGDDEVGTPPTPLSARSRLVVLDAADGSVRHERTTDGTEPAPEAFVLAGDLVVTATPDEGTLHVDASTTDGHPAWSTVLHATAPAGSTPQDDAAAAGGGGAAPGQPTTPGGPRTFLAPLGDGVAAGFGAELTVLDREGAVVRTVPFAATDLAWRHDAGTVVLRDMASARADAPSTVVRPGGDTRVVGQVLPPTVDDGSVPGLLLTSPDGLRLTARDAAGEELWTHDSGAAPGPAVLAGRVYTGTGGGVVALDARTGAEVWRSDLVREGPVVTDGDHLVAMALRPLADGRREVLVLDHADGSVVWRAPLPAGVQDLVAVAGVVLAMTSDPGTPGATTTVLGTPPG